MTSSLPQQIIIPGQSSRSCLTVHGEIPISGSKNAALPCLIATLLTSEPCKFKRLPLQLQDIKTTFALLADLQSNVTVQQDGSAQVHSQTPIKFSPNPSLVKTMRASVLVLGPLLARYGRASVSLPGGCAIGARPIDFHLMALQKMGATIEVHGTHIHAKASTLQSARITFPMPSVGATQNTLMAASLAKGETHLLNCAQEPEVIDLCSMLRKMGATLEGEGSSEIFIQGKPDLSGCTHTIMPDRIEAGTFLATALSLGGDVTVQGVHYSDLGAFLKACTQAGAQIHCGSPENPFIRLRMQNRPQSVSIQTEPFPGFPTDLQAQFMAAMCTAEGTSVIHETIFENRFMHVKELQKLGAQIELKGNQARVTGIASLRSATMQATDLRASAGLIIAGFKADTDSSLEKIHHLDRGYQNIEANFARLGISLIRANHLQDSPSPHVHQLLHPFLSHPS